ncbi:MAG: thrombospondin type 3 repeat-containing protein [Pseudomonadota bacterium]
MFTDHKSAMRLFASVITTGCAMFMLNANAQLSEYSQNFESLDQTSGSALTDDNWLVFGNVFDTDGTTYLFGYGPFGAPNGGDGFSGITTGEGGPEQGVNQLTIYNDYANAAHGASQFVEANVFQEQTISAADVGKTFTFQFDGKQGNIMAPTAAIGFIKTLDPGAGFAQTNLVAVDTSALPATWGTYSVELTIDGSLVGQLLQFGFSTTTTDFIGSGNFYDNLVFSITADNTLTSYAQNFEGMDPADPAALSDDGWLVFGNVFDPMGGFLFGYGPFVAPNNAGGFSAVDFNQGGPDQGMNQLSIFNDYNNNGAHTAGNLVESNVFQEFVIGGDSIGETYTFQFDAKAGNITGGSTAQAFIKTLDPGAGFALTNNITLDTTSLDPTWNTFTLEITIDAGLLGQLIQIGFATTATNFEGSGNFYDNITFNNGMVAVDTDGDGVDDSLDNCTLVANPDQRDSNGDGYGNICDPDFDNNGVVNFLDISGWVPFFNTACGDVDQDINGDGGCNFGDFAVITQFFNQPPGPSALAP